MHPMGFVKSTHPTRGGVRVRRMLWYGLGRPVITPKIGSWSVFRIVWMAFSIRDNHEMGRARARIVRCHHDSGNNKAASLLLQKFKQVSSAKD